MVPCGAFDPGNADENIQVRAREAVISDVAMHEGFVLSNVCDRPGGECHVEKQAVPELTPGSQVMLTTDGSALVAIDANDGRVLTYDFDANGRLYDDQTNDLVVHETRGPAQLVIGMRDSNQLVVRDREDRLAVFTPGGSVATRIAPNLGDYIRLSAVGTEHVAVRVLHSQHSQTVYVVDVESAPDEAHEVATGDITRVVFDNDDQTLVLSEGRGAEASVLVFDVDSRTLVDAFSGDLVSSHTENEGRAIEEVPGMHALSPGGEQIAYRTTSGALAVRKLDTHSSCLVRNTNRLGTGGEPSRRAGNHVVAGFAADGILYAEYDVGTSDSFVYAYDPRHQQITPLGREDGGWHLAAVPGRVTDASGDVERLWAVGVRHGSHASIAEGSVDGQAIGKELTFIPIDDDGVWAIDTKDSIKGSYRTERALSVRRVAPPSWAEGRLRFEQDPDEQIVTYSDEDDNEGPMRVPLSGRLCLSTGVPGSWAYRCGDTTGGKAAFTTDSGKQEQTNDPNLRPEFDPPFPDPDDGPAPPSAGDDEPQGDSGPSRN